MSSELLYNNNNRIVIWENKSTILEIVYDESGKFISINKEVWKDLNLNFNSGK
jgi:hypothetical protein